MLDADSLTPATSEDIAGALAFALRSSGRKRVHDAAEMMARLRRYQIFSLLSPLPYRVSLMTIFGSTPLRPTSTANS